MKAILMANEIYALHYNGDLIGHRYYKKDHALIRLYNLKKLYIRLSDAIKCRDKLPDDIKTQVEIVKYVPEITSDDLDTYVTERTKQDPDFPNKIQQALTRIVKKEQ